MTAPDGPEAQATAARAEAPSRTYAARWRHYRRVNRAASLWLVAGFPGVVGLALVLKGLSADVGIATLVVGTVAWALVWMGLCLRVTRFRCPRCEGLYFAHTQLYFGAGRHCAHCGLPLHAFAPAPGREASADAATRLRRPSD